MNTKTRKNVPIAPFAAMVLIAVVMIVAAFAPPAILAQDAGDPSGDGVVPTVVAGNPDCADIGFGFGFKINGAPNGTFPFDASNGGELTGGAPSDPFNSVTISNSDGSTFDWSATLGIDAVIVKGGPNANSYVYVPEDTEDTGLHAPVNPSNGDYYGISHIEFCYDYELTATKTADAEYTRTYTWEITKAVNPDAHSGFAGESFNSDYDITVDQTVTDSDYKVTGDITINNPTPFEVTFEVDDFVNGTEATVECPDGYTLAAGDSTVCTYVAELGDELPADGTNTATITSKNANVQGATAQDDYAFGEPTTTVGYPTINVTDTFPYPGGTPEALGSASGDFVFDNDQTFECSSDPADYTNGTYSYQQTNRAVIDETGDFDEATVTVTCYAPVISKTANTYYERDWTWTIEKSGDQTDLTLSLGQTFLVNYDVVVTATPEDSAIEVYGVITVVNPNPDEPMAVDLADELSDGVVASIVADADCDFAAGVLTVPAGETATCDYEAFPADIDNGTNTATATLNNINFVATEDYTFGDPNVETDECADFSDSEFGDLGKLCQGGATFEYSLEIGPYDICGEDTFVNIASFVTNDTQTTDSSSWTVNINVPCDVGCTLTQGYWKTHSEYGPAPYDETWAELPEGADTIFFLSEMEYYKVLWTPPAGNPYYILAHQWIAAYLNVLNGASIPADVEAAWLEAQELFETYTPEEVLELSKRDQKEFKQLAEILDDYNNGLTGPGHCSEDGRSGSNFPKSAMYRSAERYVILPEHRGR